MKKITLFALITAVVLLNFAGTGHTTLIGDSVILNHYRPNVGQVFGGASYGVTVAEGTSDTQLFFGNYYSANLESENVIFTFLRSFAFATDAGATFNGLEIDGIDDSTDGALTGVTIDTNIVGWDTASRLFFDDDTVRFNWLGLSVTKASYFNVDFDFYVAPVEIIEPVEDNSGSGLPNDPIVDPTIQNVTGAAPVPEPATIFLIGSGLLGIAGISRKKIRK
ncbi:MAG: PEP-CTERM sorting domain-containing protein [Thermodesulfobacteriota bacterium]